MTFIAKFKTYLFKDHLSTEKYTNDEGIADTFL